MIKKVTAFQLDDGRVFSTYSEAQQNESMEQKYKWLKSFIKEIEEASLIPKGYRTNSVKAKIEHAYQQAIEPSIIWLLIQLFNSKNATPPLEEEKLFEIFSQTAEAFIGKKPHIKRPKNIKSASDEFTAYNLWLKTYKKDSER